MGRAYAIGRGRVADGVWGGGFPTWVISDTWVAAIFRFPIGASRISPYYVPRGDFRRGVGAGWGEITQMLAGDSGRLNYAAALLRRDQLTFPVTSHGAGEIQTPAISHTAASI